ncbi:hypothetical protein F0L74_21660 [Chitinophaga agrisoli]|uniref:Peptidase M48-like protein n=1 Tax=Chitinophaga agrisoli TaxID=2607653 RepID=A0A5B2VIT6_9BACT|nr:hypothetical protein [Chitinophaga agrisoli]KAA2238824.1 hypothetical protein F0L74_21660 [Chitinophaga agrisoli]
MKKITVAPRLLLLASAACLLVLLSGAPALAQDHQLTDQIRYDFDTLKYYAKDPAARLEFDYEANMSSSSLQGGRVVLNIPQLQEMVRKVGKQHQTALIRLLLAHELGHQVQYRFYHTIASGLLMECQADIIAGFLLYQMMAKEFFKWMEDARISNINDPRVKQKLDVLKNEMYAGLTAIFDLGQNYNFNNSHPTSEQRRLALRDGIAYGNIWLYGEIINNPDVPGNTNAYNQTYRATEEAYKKILYYLPGDNLVTWSMRHAKKIIHDPMVNCRDIIINTTWDWDTKSSHPFLFYNHKIYNQGARTITVNFYSQIYTVLRDDPSNTLYWDLRATKGYSITLPAGESRTIADSMQWMASRELMPRFVYPGEGGSLLFCSSLSDKGEQTVAAQHYSDAGNGDDNVVLDGLIRLRGYLSDYIGNVGTILDDEPADDIYYRSKIQIPSTTETKIHYNKKKGTFSLEAEYYYGTDNAAAEAIVARIIASLTSKRYKVSEQEDEDEERRDWDIENRNGVAVGQISLWHITKSSYVVDLEIYGGK